MKNQDIGGVVIWAISLLLGVVWVIFVFSSLNDQGLYTYFNSDTLYLPSIFRDVFVDGSGFRGWHLNAAPNFFPDMASYFVVNAVVSDFRMAMLTFSVLQYVVILVLMGWVLRQISPRIGFWHLAASNLLMLLFLFVTTSTGDFVFTFYLLSISYHLGPFIMTLSALIVAFRYLQTRSGKYLVALTVVAFLGVFSSRFFIVMFVIPAFGILPLVFQPGYRRRMTRILAVAIGCAIVGVLAFNLAKGAGIYHIIGAGNKMFQFEHMASSWQTMWNQHVGYVLKADFRSVIVVVSLFSFLATAVLAVKHGIAILSRQTMTNKSWMEASYVFFFCLFFLVVLFNPIVNGSYVGPAILRYNIHVFYLGVFNMGFLMYKLFQGTQRMQLLQSLVVAATLVVLVHTALYASKHSIREGLARFSSHYPQVAQCLDELYATHDLQYGVGEYWHAKHITMFSKTGVRVYTVYHDTAIWYHVMNRNWYHEGGKGRHANPDFRFVISNGLQEDAILKELGQPIQVHKCPGSSLTVYQYPPFEFSDPRPRYPALKNNPLGSTSN